MIELYKEVDEGEDNEGVSCAVFPPCFSFFFPFCVDQHDGTVERGG
jgi:hypothetical protein